MTEYFTKIILVATVFASSCSLAADEGVVPGASIREKLNKELYQTRGSCKSKERVVDMDNLFYLKNREIKEESADSLSIAKIVREAVHIEKYDDDGSLDKRVILDVDADVAARLKEDDVDIDLSFVILDEEVALYWRETYQHQTYRQGIYKIINDDISFLCDGRGGVYKSH